MNLNYDIVRSFAFFTDGHTGSSVGLCPPDWISRYGFRVKTDTCDGLKYIWDCFETFCKACDEYHVDTVFLLGDATDGQNKKNPGMRRILVDLNDQYDAARYTLKRLLCAPGYTRDLVGISGTQYHSSADFDIEKTLIESVGGKYVGKIARLNIKKTNRVIVIRHRLTQAPKFPATALQNAIMNYLQAVGRGLIKPADVLFASHLHRYDRLESLGMEAVLCPGWKAFEDWDPLVAQWPAGTSPIGGLIWLIDKNDTMFLKPYLFKPPEIAVETLEV